jgi:1-acyl-sn-glycerol-3-phosphate acyltransferase/predicted protein tyrosine phosphatase/membrane-associated phospholipid phosphatase
MGNLHRIAGAEGRVKAAPEVRLKADATPEVRLKADATYISAGLAILFVAVYGGCNWIAAQRAGVGAWYFEWERHIPFVPVLVVPYLSIDLFYVAAPFLCRDRAELDRFARRVTTAIFVAAVFFLAMPLRFAFDRPEAAGPVGTLFDAFRAVDRPFNMFPSLHVALAMILVDTYTRHTSGATRLAVQTWFGLIVASTVLTYQHHIVDVAGGLALAALVFYAIPRGVRSRTRTANPRIAGYYLCGAALSTAVAFTVWPWSAVFLWPAVSLIVVAAGYLGAGAEICRKRDGRVALSARMLLWPYFLSQWMSLVYYRRKGWAPSEIAPGVVVGGRPTEHEAVDLIARGVTAVLDLTAEFSRPSAFDAVMYQNIPILDLTAPTCRQMRTAARFIDDQSANGIVYVHCKIGCSRSAAALGAWLLAAGRARSAEDAVEILRRARPEAREALRRFEAAMAHSGLGRAAYRSTPSTIAAFVLAGIARLICGGSPQWDGCSPSPHSRIYFANHSSHLDFLVLWAALPAEERARTRPVAARDYWNRTAVRRYLARCVFRAVLIDRPPSAATHAEKTAAARRSVARAARALAQGDSLIIFPEGTRGNGVDIAPFKCGLYHLGRLQPGVELVPVRLEHLHRIMPKGEAVPVPLAGGVTFGRPLWLMPGEDKDAFLARARTALIDLRHPCIWSSTATSLAS